MSTYLDQLREVKDQIEITHITYIALLAKTNIYTKVRGFDIEIVIVMEDSDRSKGRVEDINISLNGYNICIKTSSSLVSATEKIVSIYHQLTQLDDNYFSFIDGVNRIISEYPGFKLFLVAK